MSPTEVYQKAIDKWGRRAQLEMAQEEASELSLAVRKHIRKDSKETLLHLAEEIADVEIMIDQMRFMFPSIEKEVTSFKTFKLDRLAHRIKNDTFES